MNKVSCQDMFSCEVPYNLRHTEHLVTLQQLSASITTKEYLSVMPMYNTTFNETYCRSLTGGEMKD